jgi:serine/threonine protein kinase
MTHTKSSDLQSRVGTVIADRYRLQKLLGEGGIGAVYLAESLADRSRVAVKLLRSEYTSDHEVLARFDREARVMTALVHEHIVRAWEFGRLPNGDVALVMELVDGESLRAVYGHTRPLHPIVALEVARQLGGALAHAHAQGVVHRDLKPENIMVRRQPDGSPFIKVLDFGMARLLFGQGTPLTAKGAVFGTPEYMPPEQATGRPVNAQADQYAFGVIVFEMLSGKRPFKANTPLEMLQMQIRQPPPMLTELDPSIPPGVAQAVYRMMAKRPEDRFEDIAVAATTLLNTAWPTLRQSFPGLPPTPAPVR